MAGMAAQNIIDGLVSIVDWKDLDACCQEEGVVVLDVRGPGEIESAGELVPCAINIPLNDLRGRIDEVPRDAKKIIVSCASGQRAYYACRILSQNGFDVYNLSGAYKTYASVKPLKN